MKFIKQFFCKHNYYLKTLIDSKYYCSVGDEYYDRRSKKYKAICSKCEKEETMIDKWV